MAEEQKRGGSVINWLVLIGVIPCMLFVMIKFSPRSEVRERANRSNCKNNLKQLGLGLILYRDNHGMGSRYPPHSGDDFLIALWDSGITQEPDLFLCPSSGDDNAEGALLELEAATEAACSYAGRDNARQETYPGIFTERGASETAIACDDTEGEELFNHGDTVIVLYLDGHVEGLPLDDPQLRGRRDLGEGGLLDPLAN